MQLRTSLEVKCRDCDNLHVAKRNDALCEECRVVSKKQAQNKYHTKMEVKIKKRKTFARVYQTQKTWVEEFKSVPCSDCDKQYPVVAMQFDHVRGTKLANVSRLATLKSSQARQLILEEIDKCDVVCANCHAIRGWHRELYMKGI